jgi:hypothetical protein
MIKPSLDKTPLRSVSVLVATMLLAPASVRMSAAQTAPDSTASLVGEVQGAMTGDPAVGAIVFLRRADRGAITDSAGAFRIDSIAPGPDTLAIRYPGIDIQSTAMEFEAGTISRATFLLAERLFQVADLEVEIKRLSVDEREFDRRRRTGQGIFITREEMLERAANLPSDALRNIPRVVVSVYGIGGQIVTIGGYQASACRPRYMVDGTLMDEAFELDDVRIDDIELIEIYRGPSEVPTRYKQETNRCGLIVINIRGGGEG